MLYYRQCVLEKVCKDAVLRQTSYIPEPFCELNRVLRLRNEEGKWENGWQVISIGEKRPANIVEQHSRDWLRQRKASDI